MKLSALEGPNFSGRTRQLRQWSGLPAEIGEEPLRNGGAYIGLDLTANLSGLAPTVRAEFELLAADASAAQAAVDGLEALGFGHCLERNPFTLSGGEQVVAAVLAALAARPTRLAIDCALEQLSPPTRSALLAHISGHDVEVTVADNRLGEWFTGSSLACAGAPDAPRLHPDLFATRAAESVCVELVDLCFAYVKGRPILEGLSIVLEPGRLHLLKGPNGSGKTTLCKLLAGLLKPSAGEIRLDGKPVQPWKRPGCMSRYHYQDPDLQLFATRVGAQLPTSPARLAEALGLSALLDEHPLDLPYVLRKRLAIGCAIAGTAPLVALDEPTLGQDDNAAQALRMMGGSLAGLVISHSNVFDGTPEIRLGGAV